MGRKMLLIAFVITLLGMAIISVIIIQLPKPTLFHESSTREVSQFSLSIEIRPEEVLCINYTYAKEELMIHNLSLKKYHDPTTKELVYSASDLNAIYVGEGSDRNWTYVFISVRLNETENKSYLYANYERGFPENELEEKKQYIIERVNIFAQVCNITLNWSKANWEYWYSEGFADRISLEDFKHWVWIYAVDENAKTIDGVVCSWVGYTGNNIYRGENAEYWPQQFILSDGKKVSTYLPWISSYSGVDDNGDDIYDWYRSSARAVWEWKTYAPTDPISQTTWTKYYDGSPNK